VPQSARAEATEHRNFWSCLAPADRPRWLRKSRLTLLVCGRWRGRPPKVSLSSDTTACRGLQIAVHFCSPVWVPCRARPASGLALQVVVKDDF
jgi:hypothetical protein